MKGGMVTGAKTQGHTMGDMNKGAIRPTSRTGKQGAGLSASKVRSGSIRSSNTYRS